MGLSQYKQKRDFKKTAEPAGAAKTSGRKPRALRFVIQKHDARRLHYDFRLEMEGVLKSWAVPKGLPWAQAEKHLAVEVEDHPIDTRISRASFQKDRTVVARSWFGTAERMS